MQATRANLNTRRRQVLSLTAATAGLCLGLVRLASLVSPPGTDAPIGNRLHRFVEPARALNGLD